MSESALNILAVVGSAGEKSATRVVIHHLRDLLQKMECEVDVLDLGREPLALFDPDHTYQAEHYPSLKQRVEAADVLLLGTPDYHGSISSTLKNFLDHFWKEFAGKLFATVVASFEKGLTVTDQLRTVARQCYAWSLPYGVAFADREDLKDGHLISEALEKRLQMLAHDVHEYGNLLAAQRRADLAGTRPGFMARYRQAPVQLH